MAAASSNRSPSQPNFKTPESCNKIIRKSFCSHLVTKNSVAANPRSFNPITPANSPAAFPHKENQRDQNCLKPNKAKSPMVSKGTKNFMAPTISASSKISASPKKKVLAERNETVRISTSVNPLEFTEIEENGSKSESGFGSEVTSDTMKVSEVQSEPRAVESKHKVDHLDLTCNLSSSFSHFPAVIDTYPSLPPHNLKSNNLRGSSSTLTSLDLLDFAQTEEIQSKSEMGLDSRVSSDTMKMSQVLSEPTEEPKLKNHSDDTVDRSSSPLAPLDVDPSLPPYDPKTNYLSPRPQFLRYKPNPRIELYLNRDKEFDSGEGKRLEDSFTSESSSDTEQIEDSPSQDTQNDSHCTFSSEVESGEEEIHDSHKAKSNSRSFARPKFVPLIFVLAVACLSLSVTDSPVLQPSYLFNYEPFARVYDPALRILSDPYLRHSLAEFAEHMNANLRGLIYNFQIWGVESLSYISKTISIPSSIVELNSFQFINLTASEDMDLSGRELFTDLDQRLDFHNAKEAQEQSSIEFETEREIIEGAKEVQEQSSVKIETKREIIEGAKETQEQSSFKTETESEIKEGAKEEVGDLENSQAEKIETELIQKPNKIEYEEQPPLISTEQEIPEVEEIHDKKCHNLGVDVEPAIADVSTKESESDVDYESNLEEKIIDSTGHGRDDKLSKQTLLGISSIVLVAVAVAALTTLHLKQKKESISETPIPKQQVSPKKASESVSASSDSGPYHERRFYRNWSAEVEMVGESGPLEMSSSSIHRSSYDSRLRVGREKGETQSSERKLRGNSKRESVVASSDYSAGSPSFGSFTTYEKLHSKQRSGDENNKVTPVRRSSRIRNQITSP